MFSTPICYLFFKEKTEKQVRETLAKMGWAEKRYQDEAFDAIGALQGAIEIDRMA